MAERAQLLYIIVQEEDFDTTESSRDVAGNSFRYTRPVLQSTLQLIGCKARHAFKISQRVFEISRAKISVKLSEKNGSSSQEFPRHEVSRNLSDSEIDNSRQYSQEDIKRAAEENEIRLKEITKKLFTVQKKRCTAILNRKEFMDVVCDAMSEYRYVGPTKRSDFSLACKIREKKASMTILLCGTSGCGKSTLSTLLASRLGITTVVSTDSIRHMMRSFVDEHENPLLWASTYHAGEHLDPVAVAEAKARKMAKKKARNVVDSQLESSQISVDSSKFVRAENEALECPGECSSRLEKEIKGKAYLVNEENCKADSAEMVVSSRTMAVQGYKAQSEMVIDSLDRLMTSWEQKCESVIVEGVHLSLNFVMGLMKKHPSVIPFMIYISNEEKHLERFAVRAKYMALDPAKNKYVKYIRNIRAIQDYLCKQADKYRIPKVNNTNMDKSVASIHASIFGSLRRREAGELFHDQNTNTVKVIDEEYRNQCAANSLGSKGMLQLIHRRGSHRELMALVNTDGSVAKSWHFESPYISRKPTLNSYNNEGHNSFMSIQAPIEVSSVNLQFGNFGLSSWSNDGGETSHNGSIDDQSSRGDGNDHNSSHRSSHYGSSCSSSPRPIDGTEKELVNENTVSGSDEEQEEETLDADSEEELNDGHRGLEEELEGSVDDQSIRSDEEYDDVVTAEQDCFDEETRLGTSGTSECSGRTDFKIPTEDEWKSCKTYLEDPGSGYGSRPLKEIVGVSQRNQSNRSHTRVNAREVNRKNQHGRSKSLPYVGNYGSVLGPSFIVGNARDS